MATPNNVDERTMQIYIGQAFNATREDMARCHPKLMPGTDKYDIESTIIFYRHLCELIALQKVMPKFFLQKAQKRGEVIGAFVEKENPLPKVQIGGNKK